MRIKNGARAAAVGVFTLLAACGGKSASTPDASHGDEPTLGGGAATSSGGAPSSGAVTSSGGNPSDGKGGQSKGGAVNLAGDSSVAGRDVVSEGGSGGEPLGAAGVGGTSDCIDTCQLHGSACCVPGGDCVSPTASCRIDVLKAMIEIPRDYDELEQAVAEASPEVLFTLTDADFEAVSVDTWPGARIALYLSEAASNAALPVLASDYLQSPFIVSCNGERLFVGLKYFMSGAAAIDAPVMHVIRRQTGNLTIELGAWQGAWLGLTPTDSAVDAKTRLDRPELRATLCRSVEPTLLPR
ncbi:MAG TPA: hypothetical protein VEQ58_20770 [Polyangiaceae bacterium]|nr:hypothetical protein [Polyangiaceae bacterium]